MLFEINMESEVTTGWKKFDLPELQRESDRMVKKI